MGPCRLRVVLFGILLLFPLLSLVEETLKHLLLGELLQQFKDDWHIVVSPSLVLSLPVDLTLLLVANLIVLHLQGLSQLCHARLDRLIRLTGQLEDFFLADLKLTLTTRLLRSQLIVQFLGAPRVEGCESRVLLLQDLHLVSDNGKQIESDLVACVVLNARLDLLTGEGEPGLFRALTVRDRTTLQPIELVQSVIVRHEANEMEHIVILGRRLGLFIHDEWILPCEAIVSDSDDLGVANSVAFLLRW